VDVDVVIVSYNSRDQLRGAVEPLAGREGILVCVVDSASEDGSLDSVEGLADTRIALPVNRGFAYACNRGWQAGSAPLVLFLNPDARIEPADLARLAEIVTRPEVGCVGPRTVRPDGALEYSMRRFPRLRSRYAQALFLQRLFPRAAWADEVVHDDRLYSESRAAEWISGACMLVERSTLTALDGMDDGFFMYCEDVDLCKRIWSLGLEVRFEPAATCVHEGGASAPRSGLIPVLAESRLRYAAKHFAPITRAAERLGIGLGSLTHLLVGRGGRAVRRGHARALAVALSRRALPAG
jgi:GT2 family glycosyltransferase